MQEKMYIFSVYQNNQTEEENSFEHVKVFQMLDSLGLNPIHVAGKYKGKHEDSILVMGPVDEYEKRVRMIAKHYNQESILEIEPRNKFKTILYYLTSNKEEPIGTFTEVHPIKACQKDAYSVIEGKYYVVV